MQNIKEKLGEILGEQTPSEVQELVLDGASADSIEGVITEEFSNLAFLALSGIGLKTLKGFPSLSSLKRLELSDNQLSGGLSVLAGCKNLDYLSLGGNSFKTLEELEPLKELPSLKYLELENCPVVSDEEARDKVFEMLPQLEALDGFNKEGEEVDDPDWSGLNDDCDDEENDDEEVGLEYLHSEKVLEEDDESADFKPKDEGEDDDEEEISEDEEAEAYEKSVMDSVHKEKEALQNGNVPPVNGHTDKSAPAAPTGKEESRGVKRKHEGGEEEASA